ncbi:transposase [Escherichia albertii]|uniref:transposase n=1 Tax=Escherichia albertii TaxID=208962 RepID=UPI0023601C2B|nr:transposase [Escherichia albertii]WDB36029.1 transposase [Escherichia albertii]
MELQDWRKEPRKNYSNEFKLRMVELASQPGACVAQIARENGVNDNVISGSGRTKGVFRGVFR